MMTTSLAALAATLTLSTALADGHTASEQDVETVLEAYSGALSQEDVASAENWVLAEGEDFTIFEGSGKDVGWAGYRDHHLAPEFAAEHVSFEVYDWRDYDICVGSEMAVATFDIRMEYTVRGEARERDAHGTAILEMTPDGWRIRHLHTS